MPKSKFTAEFREQVVKEYLDENYSISLLAEKYNLGMTTIKGWVSKYREHGILAFTEKMKYSAEMKQECVKAVLSGEYSRNEIVAKYNITSTRVLNIWIKLYNANKELKEYNPQTEVYMAEAKRKTTLKERVEIVKYCIEHNSNYRESAALYDVSYNQVYYWVKKYLEYGEDGLADNRGHRKSDNELTEVECLQREVLRLKRQLEEKEKVVALLKKAKEFERM